MSSEGEPKSQATPPRHRDIGVWEASGEKEGVVGTLAEVDRYVLVRNGDACGSLDEVSEDVPGFGCGVGAPDSRSEHTVQAAAH